MGQCRLITSVLEKGTDGVHNTVDVRKEVGIRLRVERVCLSPLYLRKRNSRDDGDAITCGLESSALALTKSEQRGEKKRCHAGSNEQP